MQIELDYSTTCEPWLAQAALLSGIGLQYSREVRHMESAQSDRSLIATIVRKVNCFNQYPRSQDTMAASRPISDIWKDWIGIERLSRLAHTAWVSCEIVFLGAASYSLSNKSFNVDEVAIRS